MLDKQLNILLILHFAVKMKDNMHASEETYLLTGLTQNKISQYFNDKCSMPRSSRIALAQHVMHSMGAKGSAYIWLDNLSLKSMDNKMTRDLIQHVQKFGRLASPRGRTDAMARHIAKRYAMLQKK